MSSRTRNSKHRAQRNVLHVTIWSPRLMWIGFMKRAFRGAKLAVILAILGFLAWGLKLGIQRALYENPEFSLKAIDLNENPLMNVDEMMAITGIAPEANLFSLDVDAITRCLEGRPQVADAHVERHLPHTLTVRITARTPCAWVACPEAGLPVLRQPGALLVDQGNIAFPCAPGQLAAAAQLPVVVLPARAGEPIKEGAKVLQPELFRCLRLLAASTAADAEAVRSIDTISQANAWSLILTTRAGTVATFGLGDLPRQVGNLRAALNHATAQNYTIDTINLIPKENVPITVSNGPPPPRAIPVDEPTPQDQRNDRHARDLRSILNRN